MLTTIVSFVMAHLYGRYEIGFKLGEGEFGFVHAEKDGFKVSFYLPFFLLPKLCISVQDS